MKISEITKEDVVEYLHLEPESYSEKMLEAVMKAAEEYILEYTGLAAEEADKKEKFYIAYMVLCQDMFDNRTMYVDKSNINKIVDSILHMHSVNLL